MSAYWQTHITSRDSVPHTTETTVNLSKCGVLAEQLIGSLNFRNAGPESFSCFSGRVGACTCGFLIPVGLEKKYQRLF